MPHRNRFSVEYNSTDGYVITDSTYRHGVPRCGVLKCGTRGLAHKICDALNAADIPVNHEVDSFGTPDSMLEGESR